MIIYVAESFIALGEDGRQSQISGFDPASTLPISEALTFVPRFQGAPAG